MTARLLVTLVAVAGLAVPVAQAAKPEDQVRLAQAAAPLPIPADSATSGSTTQPAPATPPAAATPPATTPPATTTPPGAETPPDTATPPTAVTPPVPLEPPAANGEDNPDSATTPDAGAGQDDTSDSPDSEPLSLGEIPTIETMELTPDIAKRALDSYILARTKYAESDLDQYENLQDFVDQTEDGKKFEEDVKAAGFANVSDWNLAITTVGLTYASITDDQSADLEQQIKEVEDDKELAQDMKDKMVKALRALIPSENNKKIVQDLMDDPVFGPKLKQLDFEEE